MALDRSMLDRLRANVEGDPEVAKQAFTRQCYEDPKGLSESHDPL